MFCLVLELVTNNEPNFTTRYTGLKRSPLRYFNKVEVKRKKQLTKQEPEKLTGGGMKG
jgi:hypothetical protein